MVYQLSPGIVTQEYDFTTTVPGVSTTVGGLVVDAVWGPVGQFVQTVSPNDYVNKFGKPNANTFVSHFTAENFLGYSNSLVAVRANYESNTATANTSAGIRIQNLDTYTENYFNGGNAVGSMAAKYVGGLGNSIKYSICPSANAFSATHSLTANVSSGNNQIVFSDNLTNDTSRIPVAGDFINVGGVTGNLLITNVANNVVTVNSAPTVTLSGNSAVSSWAYSSQFSSAPGTSSWTSARGGSGDEMHVIVVDAFGKFTGIANTVLERWSFLSKAQDAKNDSGSGIYIRDVLMNQSNYLYWMDHMAAGTNWGSTSNNTTFTDVTYNEYTTLQGGTDVSPVDGDKETAYGLFANEDAIDVSLLMTADASTDVATYVIQSVAEPRQDCVAFVSPLRSDVVQVPGHERDNITATRNSLPSSSYAFMDDNWKLQFDRFNNVNRWVPCNGDTAGLCARTDFTRDPWYSPAGYNRGELINVIKTAWQASKADRDVLYSEGVNSIISPAGQGTILFGDKTMLSKPSAFDRINVRRLFIVLEEAISKFAQYTLFELNDRFTRSQFVAMVTPFLADIQGRNGLYAFNVICDETNNTPQVIDQNGFVATIKVQPAKSINFITLNFVATPTGVAFSEYVGGLG